MEGTVKFPATFRRCLVVAVLCGVQAQEEIPELMNMKFWSYEVWQHQQIHLLGDIMQARADHGRWEIGQGRKLTLQNADIN